jgi:DNA modification methylase
MVAVFREVRRVLRDDGTLWLNLGDSYASGEVGRKDGRTRSLPGMTTKFLDQKPRSECRTHQETGLKPKNLVGIPWRVAFALQADGWYLRSDIIWAKPNPMPESVTDRPTKAHEYLFLMSKRERYYYDAEAISERCDYLGGGMMNVGARNKLPPGTVGGQSGISYGRERDTSSGRNRRTVWNIATQPFAEAHFATFPQKLVEPCVLAGCPSGGVVFDPFMGSGTTGVVAARLGREFVGIELNAEYMAMAQRRIEAAEAQLMLPVHVQGEG